MKLGEIKIETLMLIFPSISIEVDTENDEALTDALFNLKEDPNMADYLVAMPGAINRCFSSLEQRGVLPTRSFGLSMVPSISGSGKLGYKLSALGVDIAQVEHISLYTKDAYIPRVDYIRESADIILLDKKTGGHVEDVYTIVYTPKIKRISNITSATHNIDVPDEVACLIPYYVKSEIIRADDDGEADASRALFEQGIAQLISQKEGYQSSVDTVFRM